MSHTTISSTHVEPSILYQVTYQRRTALFGIIKWYEEVKADKVSNDIHIFTNSPVDTVYLNGDRIK